MTTKIDTSKFPKVDMLVIDFITDRPKSGRRGTPAIPKGTRLFAIAYVGKPGYFTHSYLKYEDAVAVIANMQLHQTDNEFYYPWNVTKNIQDTIHVGPRN